MDKEIENRNRAKKRVLAVCCLVAVAGIGLHNSYSVFIPGSESIVGADPIE